MMTILMIARAIVVVLLIVNLLRLTVQTLHALYAPELRAIRKRRTQARRAAVRIEAPAPAPRPAQIPDIRIPA